MAANFLYSEVSVRFDESAIFIKKQIPKFRENT